MLPKSSRPGTSHPCVKADRCPGIVEADDLGTYVMKFTGAGQGRKTLVAGGDLRSTGPPAAGAARPHLVRIQLDPVIGLASPTRRSRTC